MEKKRLYISGQMTGLKEEVFKDNFKSAKELLQFEYPQHQVINPDELPSWNNGTKWSDYLREDIKVLCTCHEIHLMKNFYKSKGAWFELLVAKILGLKIRFITMKLRRK